VRRARRAVCRMCYTLYCSVVVVVDASMPRAYKVWLVSLITDTDSSTTTTILYIIYIMYMYIVY